MGYNKYSYEEGKALFDKGTKLLASGMSRVKMLKEVGIAAGTWQHWKKNRYANEPVVTVHAEMPKRKYIKKSVKTGKVWEIPFESPAERDRCIVIVTTTRSLQSVMRQL